MSIRRSPQPGQPGYVPPAHSTHDDDDVSETESITPFATQGMARDSTVRTGSIDPTTGTATSSQTIGASQPKGKDSPFRPKRAGSSRRNPEPKDEEEEEKIPETPKKKDPGGDPGFDPDPKGGSSKKDSPKGPTQVRRRIVDKEDPILKLNHLLTGTDNFAR